MHTHVLNTYNHTGERPQGCQAREHVWRQLLKLVAAKVQRAVTNQKVEIGQIERQVSQLLWHYNLTPHHASFHSIHAYVWDSVVTR
jgi:hypothetical protein